MESKVKKLFTRYIHCLKELVKTERRIKSLEIERIKVKQRKEKLRKKLMKRKSHLSVQDVKDRYKLGSDTAYELVNGSSFPSKRDGDKWFVPFQDLVLWEHEQIKKQSPALEDLSVRCNEFERSFYTTAEFQNKRQISDDTVYIRVNDQSFPSLKIRRQWRIPTDLLNRGENKDVRE